MVSADPISSRVAEVPIPRNRLRVSLRIALAIVTVVAIVAAVLGMRERGTTRTHRAALLLTDLGAGVFFTGDRCTVYFVTGPPAGSFDSKYNRVVPGVPSDAVLSDSDVQRMIKAANILDVELLELDSRRVTPAPAQTLRDALPDCRITEVEGPRIR